MDHVGRCGTDPLLVRGVRTLGVWTVLVIVWGYRFTLGPFIGGYCRFVPSCSQYMLDATRKYGPVRGVIKGVGRILRCHPWGGQGHDPA
ncbi:MAG: membrane protein insertion efficiency factor YidD [Phycisphaeraceae bacterium]|nr:membrane protein insertion efficiency factor YidD [Phycisphaeraceae bacterium]